MSKKIKQLLHTLGVENVDETFDALMVEDDNNEVIETVLGSAQTYARPFLESEFNTKEAEARKGYKGKYMREAFNIANKEFGNVLTSKEIDDVLLNPANKDKSTSALFALLKTKAVNKDTTPAAEIEQMLNNANQRIQDLETEKNSLEENYKTKLTSEINKYKLDGKLSAELIRILDGKTTIPAAKAAEFVKSQLSQRAILKLRDDQNIDLFEIENEEAPLKKSPTQLYKLDEIVMDITNEYGLVQKSHGSDQIPGGDQKPNTPPKLSGLAAKMEAAIS
jgi:hypothetical protein